MSIPFNVNEKVCNNRSGIYAIVNIKTEKFYIGSAVNFRTRKNKHLSLLRAGNHDCIHLQRSYNKHGEDVFVFKVLEYVENKNNLLDVEQKYLDIYFPTGILYNILPIAGSSLGYKHTEEAKRKIAFAASNISDETRVRMSIANRGRTVSEETRKKRSESLKGKKHTEETKLKMSLIQQNRSIETRRKLSEANSKSVCQFDKENNLLASYYSLQQANEETGINYSNISAVCLGKRKYAGGFIWKYLE